MKCELEQVAFGDNKDLIDVKMKHRNTVNKKIFLT